MSLRPSAETQIDSIHHSMRDEVLEGLRQTSKETPPKYLYDQRGCELFEQICELEEYYPTRTEVAIMRENLAEIAQAVGDSAVLLELGSGSSSKTRLLLETCDLTAYVPFDIALDHLNQTAESLRRRFPGLSVVPVGGDFTESIELPESLVDTEARRIVYFPGSTLGNFDPAHAAPMLRQMARVCSGHGGLMIGLDLRKDEQMLIRAYDDAQGVTAEFNFNLLRRFNRELNADFDIDSFSYEVLYNNEEHRIEAYLVSDCDQTVQVAGESFEFAAGERLLTEWSYKFDVEGFAKWATQFGFEKTASWTDIYNRFAVLFLEHH